MQHIAQECLKGVPGAVPEQFWECLSAAIFRNLGRGSPFGEQSESLLDLLSFVTTDKALHVKRESFGLLAESLDEALNWNPVVEGCASSQSEDKSRKQYQRVSPMIRYTAGRLLY